MKAAVYENFKGPISIKELTTPSAPEGGVVLEVKASGICRSDWWGWQGHDQDIILPHVPGHELAGIITEVGPKVKNSKLGDRVTVPFVGGCGKCVYCKEGQQQVCDQQFQPGFTAWGSFAEYVAIDYADENLVKLPDSMSFVEAASLGCRFVTSYRALVDQAKVKKGEFVAVFGCGGVGLSAILIGKALATKVIAIDICEEKLLFARSLGADYIINSSEIDAVDEIKAITKGGAHVTLDALGLQLVFTQAIKSLRKQGRHVQVGLMEGEEENVKIPINLVTGNELELLGSHGIQAYKYPEIFKLIDQGALEPKKLITNEVSLSEGIKILSRMNSDPPLGVAVINNFRT